MVGCLMRRSAHLLQCVWHMSRRPWVRLDRESAIYQRMGQHWHDQVGHKSEGQRRKHCRQMSVPRCDSFQPLCNPLSHPSPSLCRLGMLLLLAFELCCCQRCCPAWDLMYQTTSYLACVYFLEWAVSVERDHLHPVFTFDRMKLYWFARVTHSTKREDLQTHLWQSSPFTTFSSSCWWTLPKESKFACNGNCKCVLCDKAVC